ncbi:MAG: EAL domain-containing protein [Butyrivibrio sp.]|nr:EAL domain-containing protein [Butyrivibrio sp.]
MSVDELSRELEKQKALEEYVIDRIDEALEKGFIKVYYQPVIRSLTGELCSCESLARWIDPEVGFLAPNSFIGALEKSKQIHKLDCHIVKTVCKDIHDRLFGGHSVVPVSVNFSRLDFLMCDMLEVVEQAVYENDIPRDFIHIEITESMIASDADLMKREIERFRDCGYEIWMDDFGSGYSSLTLLKDYDFDMLKMDMDFLSSFTPKSKSVMQHLITMAKDIGLNTLAEGVETREQVEFLKSIGCGRLQGYYYGQPMPLDEMITHLRKKDIGIEGRQWRSYYELACFNIKSTDVPLEIVEDDGKNFTTLFMNDAYKAQIFGDEKQIDIEEIDKRIYNTPSPLLKKYRQFANAVEKSKNTETFFYTNGGSILRLTLKEIAENAGKHLIKGSIYNISMDSNISTKNNIDSKLKEVNHIFESVLLMNPEKDTMAPLLGSYMYLTEHTNGNSDLEASLEYISKKIVFPTDEAKFREFIDFSSLKKRIKDSGKGYVENIFRLRQGDGGFKWREVELMMVPGTYGKEFLYCIKATSDDAENVLNGTAKLFEQDNFGDKMPDKYEYAKLLENFIWNTSIKFFWKDKNRRYRGVSKAFLDFFGFNDQSEVVGKTDEDLHWHIKDDTFINDELEILATGKKRYDISDDMIVKGVSHKLLFNKFPVYDSGVISGIMGYFIDSTQEKKRMEGKVDSAGIDNVTGLMDTRGFVEALIDYSIKYNIDSKNFGVIVLKNVYHDRIVSSFGEAFGNKVLKEMAERILEVTGLTSAVSRTKENVFSLLLYAEDREELAKMMEQVKGNLEYVSKVDGKDITIRIKSAFKMRTDEDVNDENIYIEAIKLLEENDEITL